MANAFISRSCIMNLAPSESDVSPLEGNESEMSDRYGGGKNGVSSARADWLIAICQLKLCGKLPA